MLETTHSEIFSPTCLAHFGAQKALQAKKHAPNNRKPECRSGGRIFFIRSISAFSMRFVESPQKFGWIETLRARPVMGRGMRRIRRRKSVRNVMARDR